MPVDLTSAAKQIAHRARAAGVELRLLGSTAVKARCPSALGFLDRHGVVPQDIDLAAMSHQRSTIRSILLAWGFRTPQGGVVGPYMDREVLLGTLEDAQIRVEVFFDELRFVHAIRFVEDFSASFPTLCLDTLIMSKLQIRRTTLRDAIHLAALLIQAESEQIVDAGSFSLRRITRRAAQDYRCWRDFIATLEWLDSSTVRSRLECSEEEGVLLGRGIQRITEAVRSVSHGPAWWLGRVKAGFGVEPAEPEDLIIREAW